MKSYLFPTHGSFVILSNWMWVRNSGIHTHTHTDAHQHKTPSRLSPALFQVFRLSWALFNEWFCFSFTLCSSIEIHQCPYFKWQVWASISSIFSSPFVSNIRSTFIYPLRNATNKNRANQITTTFKPGTQFHNETVHASCMRAKKWEKMKIEHAPKVNRRRIVQLKRKTWEIFKFSMANNNLIRYTLLSWTN